MGKVKMTDDNLNNWIDSARFAQEVERPVYIPGNSLESICEELKLARKVLKRIPPILEAIDRGHGNHNTALVKGQMIALFAMYGAMQSELEAHGKDSP